MYERKQYSVSMKIFIIFFTTICIRIIELFMYVCVYTISFKLLHYYVYNVSMYGMKECIRIILLCMYVWLH